MIGSMRASPGHAFLLALGLLAFAPAGSGESAPETPGAAADNDRSSVADGGIVLLPVDDAIGPATSDYFVRALEEADESGAQLVIVTLDTPGGLDTAMRDMIQAILASKIPVVAYVSPSGARAASAGTYLVYASHVAAMAPATNLGAATPVQIGGAPGGGRPPVPDDEPSGKDDQEPVKDRDAKPARAPSDALERKAVNDAVAYLRSLAELRGRNADWAEAAVREGASLSASDALKQGVIDLMADDLPSLLTALDGRTVRLPTGEVTIRTAGLPLQAVEPDWRTRLLSLITNPNVAYLLMLIGIYGLLLEGYNPGSVLPGVVGAISLLLALFAFQVLSVNYAGLALIALGVLLIIAESFAPSFGTLGLGGIVSFVIGSVMLLDDDVPGFGIAWQLIGTMALAGSLLLLAIVSFAVRARRRPVVSGGEALLAERAEAIESFDARGMVRVHGELWNATTRTPVRQGQRLRILSRDGLTLVVEPESDSMQVKS
jgi:membrane-bound serine protease (ClpP class)